MQTRLSHVFGVALTLCCVLFVLSALLLSKSFTQSDCSCGPSHRPASTPRFPPGAAVQVYIDNRTGFSAPEKTAIQNGFEDWNDEPNNTGVTFVVQETDNPPALPPASPNSYIVVVNYEDHFSSVAIGETQTFSGTNGVWNIVTMYRNIRSGSAQVFLDQLIRSVTRHEAGHMIGLEHPAENCGPGQTIMLLFESGETFINWCDNQALNADPFYGVTR